MLFLLVFIPTTGLHGAKPVAGWDELVSILERSNTFLRGIKLDIPALRRDIELLSKRDEDTLNLLARELLFEEKNTDASYLLKNILTGFPNKKFLAETGFGELLFHLGFHLEEDKGVDFDKLLELAKAENFSVRIQPHFSLALAKRKVLQEKIDAAKLAYERWQLVYIGVILLASGGLATTYFDLEVTTLKAAILMASGAVTPIFFKYIWQSIKDEALKQKVKDAYDEMKDALREIALFDPPQSTVLVATIALPDGAGFRLLRDAAFDVLKEINSPASSEGLFMIALREIELDNIPRALEAKTIILSRDTKGSLNKLGGALENVLKERADVRSAARAVMRNYIFCGVGLGLLFAGSVAGLFETLDHFGYVDRDLLMLGQFIIDVIGAKFIFRSVKSRLITFIKEKTPERIQKEITEYEQAFFEMGAAHRQALRVLAAVAKSTKASERYERLAAERALMRLESIYGAEATLLMRRIGEQSFSTGEYDDGERQLLQAQEMSLGKRRRAAACRRALTNGG
jgi:hypothetical protein